MFNAELSPKRYWQVPRSQKVGEEGVSTYRYTVTTRMTPVLRWRLYLSPYCHHHNDSQIDCREKYATLTSGLPLGRCEALKSLIHYLRAQSRGHHTIDRLEGGVERSARRSFLKGRERAIVNQTNIGTVSKATLGKLLRDGVERIWAFPSAKIPPRTELN